MTTARILIIARRRREAQLGDRFARRLMRLDRHHAPHPPLFAWLRMSPIRRAA
jgi:hypothetical protein